MKNKIDKYKIIFLVLIIIGILARIYNFPTAITEMNSDEIITAINAKSIIDTTKDLEGNTYPIYLQAWGGQSVMLLYIISIKLFGYTLFSIRFPMLFISIISLFVFYDFIKKLTQNKKVAILGLALIAICPWHIQQSIWSLDCNMFPHFLLIAMDLIYTAVQKQNKKILYISIVAFSICLYCYGLAIYFVPLFLLITAIYLLKNKKVTIKDVIICMLIFIILAAPIVTMFIINLFKLNSISIGKVTIPYCPYLSRTNDMLLFAQDKLHQLIKNIGNTLYVIFAQDDGAEWNSTPIFGTVYLISIVFVIISIIKFIKNRKDEQYKFARFMLVLWGVISIITGFAVNNVNINRLNSIWYLMLILTTLGIYFSYNDAKNKKTYKYFIIAIYTILFVSYSIYFYTYFYKKVDNSGCFSKGFYKSLEYINTIQANKIYYDNIIDDGNLKLYIRFKGEKTKNYYEIRTKEELEEKINNLQDDEAIIIENKNLQTNKCFDKFGVIQKTDVGE